MNVRIPYSWIKDYLKTNLSADEFAEKVSLIGPSIERVESFEDDFVFDIEVTPNRVDAACVLGMAQEGYVALYEDEDVKFVDKFKGFDYKSFKQKFDNNSYLPKVSVFETGSSRYIAFVMEDCQIGPSPEFIQKRLKASGIKVINNVVDISNYVMLELAQPNHIFDLDRLEGEMLKMEEVKEKTKMLLLDGREVDLEPGDLIFVDGKGRIVDLCGIMGGGLSSVQRTTKRLLVTIPVYNKQKIRSTSMRLGIRTEAAVYFEKGIDEERSEKAAKLLVDLLSEYTKSRVTSKIFDFYPKPYTPREIVVNQDDINRLIGVEISVSTSKKILQRLGFTVSTKGKELYIKIPAHRKNDVENLQDIVEEVARVYGYHKLPSNLSPFVYIEEDEKTERIFNLQSRVKYLLKDNGFNEVMNYSMISSEMIKAQDEKTEDYLRITMPINKRFEFMRRNLFSSLIENVKDNKGFVDSIRIFELAKIYNKKDLSEHLHLAIAVSGDYYHLKAVLELIFSELNIKDFSFRRSEYRFLSFRQAEVFIKDVRIGFLGELSQKIEPFKTISLAELDFERLAEFYSRVKQIRPIPKFSIIKLDYNFFLSPELNFEKLYKVAFETSKYLYNIELVDVYQERKITLRFSFTDYSRNLTEEEAVSELKKILNKLGLKFEKQA